MIGVKNNNPGGGASAVGTKVTLREVKVPGFVADISDSVAFQAILNQVVETVAAREVIFLIAVSFENGISGPANTTRFAFRNNQATTTFGPLNPILVDNLIPINKNYGISTILTDLDTQIIGLGDLEGASISDFVNAKVPSIMVQNESVGMRIFTTELNGVLSYYLFIADGGDYGFGKLQSSEEDFIPFSKESGVPSLFSVLQIGDRIPKILHLEDFIDNNYTFQPGDEAYFLIVSFAGSEGNFTMTVPYDPFETKSQDYMVWFGRTLEETNINATLKYISANPGEQQICGAAMHQSKLNDIASIKRISPNTVAVSYRSGKTGDLEFSFCLTQVDETAPEWFKTINDPIGIDFAECNYNRDGAGAYSVQFPEDIFDENSYPRLTDDVGIAQLVFDTSGTILGYIFYFIVNANTVVIHTRNAALDLADNILKRGFIFKLNLYKP